MGLYVHGNHKGLIGTGKLGGQEILYLTPTRYTVTTRMILKVGNCVSHFNVSLIVQAESQESVHKPQFLKRRERRAKVDRTEVLLLTSLAPYR